MNSILTSLSLTSFQLFPVPQYIYANMDYKRYKQETGHQSTIKQSSHLDWHGLGFSQAMLCLRQISHSWCRSQRNLQQNSQRLILSSRQPPRVPPLSTYRCQLFPHLLWLGQHRKRESTIIFHILHLSHKLNFQQTPIYILSFLFSLSLSRTAHNFHDESISRAFQNYPNLRQ